MTMELSSDTIHAIEQAAAAGLLTADSPANLKIWLTRESLAAWRPGILQLIADEKWSDLDAMFWTSIPFGTGGRRGPMGEMGPATINDRILVVKGPKGEMSMPLVDDISYTIEGSQIAVQPASEFRVPTDSGEQLAMDVLKHGDQYQCHFVKGSEIASVRLSKVDETLKSLNLETERVQNYEVAITDIERLPKLINDYAAKIQEIGMSPFKF